MHDLSIVATFRAAPDNVDSGVTDLIVAGGVLYAATRAGGGVMALDVAGAGIGLINWRGLAPGGTLPAPSRLTLAELGGDPGLIVTGPAGARIGGFTLDPGGALGGAAGIAGSTGRTSRPAVRACRSPTWRWRRRAARPC